MAAPCVSCELTLKSGEKTQFKCNLATRDGSFSHKSIRDALNKVQVDLNAFLTVQVEKDKQEFAQQKKGGLGQQTTPDPAGVAGAGDDTDPDDEFAGDESDDIEDDGDDEDENVQGSAENAQQSNKREAENENSSPSKKSKSCNS